MNISRAEAVDCTVAIHKLYMDSFGEEEREVVAKLATDLLTDKNNYSYIAQIDGKVVGHIAFSPITIEQDSGLIAFILSPLAVHPDYQKQKVGSSLIEHGIGQLKTLGAHLIFVYGDPDYYGKFGFQTEAASGYLPPYKLQYPFGWQALKLNTVRLHKSVNISCVPALHNAELW